MATVYQRAATAFQQGAPVGASIDVGRNTSTFGQASATGSLFAQGDAFRKPDPFNRPVVAETLAALPAYSGPQEENAFERIGNRYVINPVKSALKPISEGLHALGVPLTKVGDYYESNFRFASEGTHVARNTEGIEGNIQALIYGAKDVAYIIPGVGFIDPAWRKQWDLASQAESSPAQTAWLMVANDADADPFTLLDDEENNTRVENADGSTELTAREEYFGSGVAKWVTGTADFAFNVFADPLVIGGKVAGVARYAANTIKVDDVAAVAARHAALTAGEGEEAARLAAQKAYLDNPRMPDTAIPGEVPGRGATALAGRGLTVGGRRVDATINRAVAASERVREEVKAGKHGGYSQLSQTALFAQTADAGAIPAVFRRIDDLIVDDAERVAMKKTAILAGMGSRQSMAELAAKDVDLALEIQSYTGPIRATAIENLLRRPGYTHEDNLKAIDDDEFAQKLIDRHTDEINEFRASLQRANEVGSDGVLTGDALAKTRGSGQINRLTDTNGALDFMRVGKTIHRGAGLPPIHVLVGNHLPGTFNLSGAEAPAAFQAATQRAAKVFGKDANFVNAMNKHLDDFHLTHSELDPAAARAARRIIIDAFHKDVRKALVRKHTRGLAKDEATKKAQQINHAINDIQKRKGAEDAHLLNRAQEAINVNRVGWHQDAEGIWVADRNALGAKAGRPHAGTELEELVSIVDYKKFDRILTQETAGASLEGFMRKGLDGVWELTDQGLTWASDLWKFSALFRVGYVFRNQVDAQARMLAKVGVIDVIHNAMIGSRNLKYNLGRVSRDEVEHAHIVMAAQLRIQALEEFPNEANLAQIKKLEAFIAKPPPTGADKLNKSNSTRRRNTPLARHLGQDANDRTAAYWGSTDFNRTHDQIDARPSTLGLMVDGERSQLSALRAKREFEQNGNVRAIGGSHSRWVPAYVERTNHIVRNDPALMAILRGADDKEIRAFYLENHAGRQVWAGLTERWHGNLDLMIHRQREQMDTMFPTPGLKARVMSGEMTEQAAKAHWPKASERPGIPTEMLQPPSGNGLARFYNRSRSWYFKVASSMPETMLARHPFYVDRYEMHIGRVIANAGGDADKLTLKQINAARARAGVLARRDVGKYMFDTAQRSNLAHHLRFVSPFYMAWSDTMRKWSRIIGDQPEILPLIPKVFMAPNAAFLVTDEDGNRILSNGDVVNAEGEVIRHSLDFTEGRITIPTPDFISKWATGSADTDVQVSKSALNVIFQGSPFYLPGPGPLVQIPANHVFTRMFPEWADDPIAAYILPTGTTNASVLEQLQPSVQKNAWLAFAGKFENDRFAQTYSKLLADEMQAVRMGKSQPRNQKDLEALITNRTRNWYMLSALGSELGFTTTPTSRLDFWRNEFQRYRREYGADATQKFYEEYPDYFEATLSLSSNETGLVATDESWNAAQKYARDIKANPEYGWMFAGAANVVPGFDAGIYTAQKVNGQRTTKNPAEAYEQMVVQRGWMDYMKFAGALNLKLEERKANGGSASLSANSNADLKAIKDEYLSSAKEENVAWANAYEAGGNGSAIGKFIRTAETAVADNPELAERSDFRMLGDYMRVREAVQEKLHERGLVNINAQGASDLKAIVEDWLASAVASDIGFEQMYNRARLADDDMTLLRPNFDE